MLGCSLLLLLRLHKLPVSNDRLLKTLVGKIPVNGLRQGAAVDLLVLFWQLLLWRCHHAAVQRRRQSSGAGHTVKRPALSLVVQMGER